MYASEEYATRGAKYFQEECAAMPLFNGGQGGRGRVRPKSMGADARFIVGLCARVNCFERRLVGNGAGVHFAGD